MNCVFQIKFVSEGGEIVGIGVHVVAIPRLRGTAVAAPVVGDDSIALLAEEQHLSVPVVGGERPSVTEHYGLALAPVLVVNVGAIFQGESGHSFFSFVRNLLLLRNLVPRNNDVFRAGRRAPGSPPTFTRTN